MAKRFLTLVVGTVIGANCAWAADPDGPAQTQHDQLTQRLDRIEAGLQRLEAGKTDHWLSRRRADEIRGLVSDVLADADTRTGLKDTDLTGGWDDGFFVQSDDGNFRLEVSGQLQLRWVWNRRRKSNGTLDTRASFEVRRAKIKLDGHLISPDLGYTIGLAHSPARGFVLQSFNVRYRVSDTLLLLVGRARPPLLREEQMSSKRQLATERSLVSKSFAQTRTVGLMLRYRDDLFRVSAGIMDASITNPDPSVPLDELLGQLAPGDRWRASTRAEVLLTGRWKELDDFSSFPG
ncbi:MAG: porin, partial [Phycisphaerales bacterium]